MLWMGCGRASLTFAVLAACGSPKSSPAPDAATDASVDGSAGDAMGDAPRGTLTPDLPDPVGLPCASGLRFATPPVVGVPGVSSMATGYINADVHVDVLMTTSTKLYVAYGNGDGTFGVANQLATLNGQNPNGLIVVNVDNANGDDAVFRDSSTVTVMKNNGDGTFASPQSLGIFATDLLAVDLDTDGDKELLVLNGNVHVFVNNGTDLAAPVTYSGLGLTEFAAGDLSGDGKPDLALVNTYGSLAILINNGSNGFASPISYAVPNGKRDVVIGDFNGDGKPDVGAAGADYNLSVYLNQGAGALGTRVDYASGVDPHRMAVADIDGDAKADVAMAGFDTLGSYSLTIAYGAANGSLSTARHVAPVGANQVALADVNADGRPDAALAGSFNEVVFYLNEGNQSRFSTRSVYAYPTTTGPGAVRFVHASADANVDLLTSYVDQSTNSSQVSVRLGDGAGGFTQEVLYSGGLGPVVELADLDNDGDADVIGALWTLQVLLRDGGGLTSLPAMSLPMTTAFPRSMAIGDVDNDGWRDVVIAFWDAADVGAIQLVRGRGDGTFHPATPVAMEGLPFGVALADVDKDSAIDLLATFRNQVNNTQGLSIARGNGAGMFTQPVAIPSIGLMHTASRDLNKDGHPDAISLGSLGGLEVRLGDGVSLGASTTFGDAARGLELAFGDVNGDGNLDAITAVPTRNVVSVFVGTGTGAFLPPMAFDAGATRGHLTIADVNGDGRLDIAVDNGEYGQVSVLLGRCGP
jgi:hypothetical protein